MKIKIQGKRFLSMGGMTIPNIQVELERMELLGEFPVTRDGREVFLISAESGFSAVSIPRDGVPLEHVLNPQGCELHLVDRTVVVVPGDKWITLSKSLEMIKKINHQMMLPFGSRVMMIDAITDDGECFRFWRVELAETFTKAEINIPAISRGAFMENWRRVFASKTRYRLFRSLEDTVSLGKHFICLSS